MSDENIKNKENQDKKEEQNEININDLKEPLMFVDEEKINQKNSETKSCLKKDKTGQKPSVKIIVPESDNQNLNEVIKERRKKRPQFKTVKEPVELKDKKLLNMDLKKDIIIEEEITKEDSINEIKPKKFKF